MTRPAAGLAPRPPPSLLGSGNKTSPLVCLNVRCVPQLMTSVQPVRNTPTIGIASPMKPLTEWFTGMNIGAPALLLAIAAGLIVVLVFIVFGRRRESPRDFRPQIHLPQSPVGSADWENAGPPSRHDERRRSIRRSGLPTPILVIE